MNDHLKQYTLPLPHVEAMDAEDFMVTESNRLAVDWLQQWPNWAGRFSALKGPVGSGKTHLLKVWQARSNARLITSADLENKRATEIASETKIIAFDDAEGIAGNPIAEENLFHLYNFINEHEGFLLLASRAAPISWDVALPDLRSRLTTFHTISIALPDDHLLAALLIKQFKDRQIAVNEGVINYILINIERSAEAVHTLVSQLDGKSLELKRPISLRMVQDALTRT